MPRPAGSRSATFAHRRDEIARRAGLALLDPGGGPASFRALAAAAGASASVIQHYFGGLDGLVVAALAAVGAEGAPYLRVVADPGPLDLPSSLRRCLGFLREGWLAGVGRLHAAGLVRGLGHASFGPAYVQHMLEPTLAAYEARLGVHQARGELRPDADLRLAALGLLSPALLALLHQEELSGRACRPLDVEAFLDGHVEAFVRAWGPDQARFR
jgi:AcrR family transcriptional regulator